MRGAARTWPAPRAWCPPTRRAAAVAAWRIQPVTQRAEVAGGSVHALGRPCVGGAEPAQRPPLHAEAHSCHSIERLSGGECRHPMSQDSRGWASGAGMRAHSAASQCTARPGGRSERSCRPRAGRAGPGAAARAAALRALSGAQRRRRRGRALCALPPPCLAAHAGGGLQRCAPASTARQIKSMSGERGVGRCGTARCPSAARA